MLLSFHTKHDPSSSLTRIVSLGICAFRSTPRPSVRTTMPAYSSRYTQSEASSPPPPPDRGRRASARQRRPRDRGYSGPREKPRRDVTIIMCVYKQRSHNWHSVPLSFDPYRTTDEELWSQIRDIYRNDLQPGYKRLFGFKKLKYVLPCPCALRCSLIEI